MPHLDGKVAIVTGAGRMRGLGRGMARALAEAGADVVVSARGRSSDTFPDHEKDAGWKGASSVAEEIAGMGRRSIAVDTDVTDADQVGDLVRKTVDEFGRLDVLVNNAGLATVSGGKNLWETDEADWRREVDVNLTGVFLCCKAVAPLLIDQGEGGRIVNISSLAGVRAQPQYGGYTPSKFGVNGLTQMLALEMAPHKVTVNSVCPGSADTDMMDGTFNRTADRMRLTYDQIKAGAKGFIPLGRQAEVAEIASMVAYLASPAAAYITGQVICVDGGVGLR
jgi:3-oxoacyl-[acyl-carrier protein] reductase/meso-butanediol dehydrogenase/(S,S)-butanediol dehydrogenase/diacetyl reductase